MCHPTGVKRGFIKGEALRLLRTNSSRITFEENIKKLKTNLIERGYPEKLTQETLSEVKFESRKEALTQKQKQNKLKTNTHKKLAFIEQQPQLNEIFREPPIVSYKRGRSLKDILVKAKL